LRCPPRLKNHPVIAIVLVAALAIGGAASVLKSAKELYREMFSPTASVPKMKTWYFAIRGDGIALLLQGELDQALGKLLGGKPIVWRNDVYRAVAAMHSQLSRRSNVLESWQVFVSASLDPNDVAGLARNAQLLPGAAWDARELDFDIDLSSRDWPTGVDLSAGWVGVIGESALRLTTPEGLRSRLSEGRIYADEVQFERWLSCQEALQLLNHAGSRLKDYFRFLAEKGGCPRKFFFARILWNPCGSGGWFLSLTPPVLGLRILVVENVAKEPVAITKLVMRATRRDGFDEMLERQPARQRPATVGDGILRPEDRLIIPLYMFFEHRKETVGGLKRIEMSRDELRGVLGSRDELQVIEPPELGHGRVFPLSAAALKREDVSGPIDEKVVYYFGQTQVAESVSIDGAKQEIRPLAWISTDRN